MAALRISLGVILWALHFTVIYGFTALACARGFGASVSWVVGAATVVAAAAAIGLIVIHLSSEFTRWMTAAVAAAKGAVGPPLDAVARRVYLGGVLPNSPGNMARFIRRPQEIDPRTAMPDLGVTEAHARDMVAYLYTLK